MPWRQGFREKLIPPVMRLLPKWGWSSSLGSALRSLDPEPRQFNNFQQIQILAFCVHTAITSLLAVNRIPHNHHLKESWETGEFPHHRCSSIGTFSQHLQQVKIIEPVALSTRKTTCITGNIRSGHSLCIRASTRSPQVAAGTGRAACSTLLKPTVH